MVSETCLCIQAALFYVLKESFKVYKAVSEGLINLADKFFDMDYFNAQRALEIYKESILSAERLQVPCCKKVLCGHICRNDCVPHAVRQVNQTILHVRPVGLSLSSILSH